jgi:hypothetical protein
VYVVFKSLVHDELKVRTFGAIAVIVFAFITNFFHAFSKPTFGFVDVIGNSRKVSKLQGRTVLFYQFHQIDVVELKCVFV